MIDASSFAAHHIAFWADHTPTSEHLVRRINLDLADRWSPPIPKPAETIRASFVSEYAFSRFCGVADGMSVDLVDEFALTETKRRLRPLVEDRASLDAPFSSAERSQVEQLEASLREFFRSKKGVIKTRPLFKGCGFIDASEADVISGTCLFEIKAVDRPFRSADVRQLVTYCALNHASGQFSLQRMGLFNPRRGLWFTLSCDEVCREISGQSAQDLFDSVVHGISSGGISR